MHTISHAVILRALALLSTTGVALALGCAIIFGLLALAGWYRRTRTTELPWTPATGSPRAFINDPVAATSAATATRGAREGVVDVN